jgi:hypothetical protein
VIEIGEVKVQSFVLDQLTISWQVEIDPEENILEYELFLLRSESPEGEFEVVSPGLFDTLFFIDQDVGTRSKWRKFYYKIKAVHNPSSLEFFSESADSYVPTDLNLIGLEVARRNDLLLQEFVGTQCTLFIMRRTGPRCPDCWDFKKRQVRKSNCESCFRVGRAGGYYSPINPLYLQISPHGQVVDHANIGIMEPAQTSAWTSNFPLITPGDVVVEPSNRRWRVASVGTTEQFRVPVRQMLQLYHIDPSDVEYKLEIPNG